MDQNKSKSDLVVDALIEARNNKGLSQRELASRLRVSQSKIASIENGKRTLTLDMASLLARELDVDLAPMLGSFQQEQLQKHEEKSRTVIELFNRLSFRDREAVLALVRYFARNPSERERNVVAYSPDELEEIRKDRYQRELEWRERMIEKLREKNPDVDPSDYLPDAPEPPK